MENNSIVIKSEDSDEELKEPLIEDKTDNKKDKSTKCPKIHIDMKAIPCLEVSEQDLELKDLGITAFDQNIYEENVMLQVDRALDTALVTPLLTPLDTTQDNDINDQQKHSSNQKSRPVFDLQSKDSESSFSPLIDLKNKRKNRLDQKNDKQNKSSKSDYKSFDRMIKINEIVGDLADSDTNDLPLNEDSDEWQPLSDDCQSEQEFEEPLNEYDSEEDLILNIKQTKSRQKVNKEFKEKRKSLKKRIVDDGSDHSFKKRIEKFKKELLKEKHENIRSDGTEIKDLNEMIKLEEGFQIPKRIWDQLFPYQQTGVQWLWELHQLGCGGIVGDEMGLGKTIQIIAFLCGLSCTRIHDFRDLYKSLGPVLLVCPTTVMHQWVAEFHKWWPYFRVAILHQTGSFGGKKETLIKAINKSNGILITSYSGVCAHQKQLLRYDWHYFILDEGHKIRNPDAQVTHACKLFGTPHRVILSGSPIQNNLRELWSLFDFIYPGKLGTLPIFIEHFAVPITQGGYSNASEVQIQVAYKMATILRDSIKPYLLRRMKDEVKSCLSLPPKNEQVLFCKLTEEQRELYKSYIDSSAVKEIMRGSTQIFVGLINLRKICNHPNLFNKCSELNLKEDFDYYKRSGKMIVVDALLRIWQKQSHKVLIFTQSRQMIKIIEKFIKYRNYNYLIMDGTTSVQTRQPLIKQFNSDPKVFIFLLTTRVGGIGVNLTGATRALIYDPDWNPSTDVQARERCWRIGQNKSVTIYRLLSAGTVEEKIYHRQIFKQYLTNRVLKDPKQRRFFKTNDLHELFTLGSDSTTTESSAIFAGTESEVKVKQKSGKKQKNVTKDNELQLSAEKVEELRNRAKLLSKMIAEKFANKDIQNKSNSNSEECDSKMSETVSQPINSLNKTEFIKNLKPENKKKKKKGTKFEGKRIEYLVKQDVYKQEVPQRDNSDDEYVLKKLFKGSKVQTALQHDMIESTSTPDYALAEREAETVAKQAITALKKSRELCFSGQSALNSLSSNSSKRFGQKRKFSVSSDNEFSSNSLMNEIKTRNKFQSGIDSFEANSSDTNTVPKEYDTLLSDIRNFIAFQSKSSIDNRGETTTQELLDAFKDKLPAHQSAVFKSMLYQLCDFFRRPDKTGVWKLKSEFR